MTLLEKIILTAKTIKNRGLFLLDFMGFLKNRDVLYRLNNGQKFFARGGTTDASEIIVINSGHEYPKKYFPHNFQPAIVDIGANIGCFSVYTSKELKHLEPRIYAIEPSKENFTYLNKNLKNNELQEQKVFNIAISDRNGQGYLDIESDADAFHLLDEEKRGAEIVQLMTLMDFCKNNNLDKIDLMKVDIEGGEYALFENAGNFIKENVKTMFLEIHNLDENRNIDSLMEKFSSLGLEVAAKTNKQTFFLRNKHL